MPLRRYVRSSGESMSQAEPQFVIKICGITRQEDLRTSLDAGANAIGFNFYEKSPRYLNPENARNLETPPGCLRVGVFVNASAGHAASIAKQARLDVLQLHGRYDDATQGSRIWRSVAAGSPLPDKNPLCEAWLLDTPTPDYGGSGRTFDWTLAQNFPFRIVLAGGLGPDNVADAISAVHPWGVDACSRLESSPGRKDAELVRRFVANALAASENLLKQEVSL